MIQSKIKNSNPLRTFATVVLKQILRYSRQNLDIIPKIFSPFPLHHETIRMRNLLKATILSSRKAIAIVLVLSFFLASAPIQRVSATPAGDNILISEVEYDVVTEYGGEWFSLYNPTHNAIDISGWTITDGEGIVTFPAGTTIAAQSFFLAVNTSADFLNEHPTLSASDIDLEYKPHVTYGTFALANGGDELTLSDSGGNEVDSLSWGGSGRWDISASEGHSIARASRRDTDTAADWLSDQSPSPTGLNAAPTDIQLDGGDTDRVNENRLVGAEVGTLTTTDADAGDSHTYSLVAGAGDDDNGSFTISGDQLLLNTVPDYETKTSYSVRIQTDDGWATYAKAFTISVVDLATEADDATTKVWKLDTPANYTLSDASKIEVTTGIARLVANVPIFDNYWELDEASWNGTAGEVTDSADSGNGTATRADTFSPGVIGRAGRFTRASKEYVDFGTAVGNPGINDFAFGLWFRSTNSGDDMSMIARSVYSAADGRYALLLYNGTVRVLLDLGPNFVVSSPASNYNDGNWHFAVVNVDRDGDLSLYLDNTLVKSTSIAGRSNFDFRSYIRNLYLGAYNDPDGIGVHNSFGYFDGDLDEAFFINRLLTPAEINTMWNGGNGARLPLERYSSRKPYVTAKQSVTFSSTLLSFNEVLSQNNEGTVTYQVSTDDGLTWQYWDGSDWVPTTDRSGAETSTAADINAHIATLDTDGGKFTWRAFLNSDGTQKVELDQVEVTFRPNQPPTDIQLDGADSDRVDENRLSGAEIGVFTTTDPDPADTHTYSLVAGAGDADNGKFAISGDRLLLNAAIDYEAQPTYTIRVQSDDGHGGVFQKSFTIHAVDIVHEEDNATTEVWKLNTPANYTLSDAHALEFQAGVGRLAHNLIFDNYWALDEASWNGTAGEVVDSADGGNGTATGAETIADGKIGRGGHFDRASKEYVDFGTTVANPGANDFSYGIWFQTTSTEFMSMMARSVYSAADGRYALLINNGQVMALLDRGTTNRNVTSSSRYNDGRWHLAIVTMDSDGLHRLYIDGAEVAWKDCSPEDGFDFSGLERNLYIGAYNDPDGIGPHDSFGYYDGNLDEAFFINRLLTPAEIAEIYNAGAGKRLRRYASNSPYITASHSATFARTVDSFTAYLSQNNEGTVTYQVSTDGGATWQYWNGSAWATATATDGTETSTAADINAHIAALDTDGGEFTWRAFLNSDGSQKVELDQVDITYDAGITVSAISGDTSEDGATATFDIVLNSQPTADVRIDVSSDDTTEGTVSPTSVTFTPANWNTPQTLTVTGVDDALIDGVITYHIVTHPAVSADANYNGLDPADVTVRNRDNEIPLVVFGAHTIPANNARLESGPTRISVEFNMDVKSGGSADPGAADNPANYMLVRPGPDGVFNTISCHDGFDAQDVRVPIDAITYSNAGPYIATLEINGGEPLGPGRYRLYICGTTSIENLVGTKLNNGLADTLLTFEVLTPETLPATGFRHDQMTQLPAQPAAKAYADTALTLVIPKLGVDMPIVGVPAAADGWDVTWLGDAAGWLEGSAFPTWAGNTILTAHVWDAYNRPGPFADLKTLRYGDIIEIHAWGQVYVYEVRESKLLGANASARSLFRHEETDVLTLLTCEGYNPLGGEYLFRRAVKAVLVNVK